MKFYVRHWYSANLFFLVVLGLILLLNGSSFNMIQILVMLNLMALIIHQFEEYCFPGGEPAIMNIVLQNSDIPNRYPLNQFSAMFTNVFTAIIMYGIAIFFPNIMWLSLAPMLFNFGQFIIHGIVTNKMMKTFYNPGLGAVVFLHLPISIYYFWYVNVNQLLSPTDWLFGILFTILCAGFGVGIMTYILFASRNSKWVFDDVEMARFHVQEKLKYKNIRLDNKENVLPMKKIQEIQRKLHKE